MGHCWPYSYHLVLPSWWTFIANPEPLRIPTLSGNIVGNNGLGLMCKLRCSRHIRSYRPYLTRCQYPRSGFRNLQTRITRGLVVPPTVSLPMTRTRHSQLISVQSNITNHSLCIRKYYEASIAWQMATKQHQNWQEASLFKKREPEQLDPET